MAISLTNYPRLIPHSINTFSSLNISQVGTWSISIQHAECNLCKLPCLWFFFYTKHCHCCHVLFYVIFFSIRSSTQARVIDYAAHHGPQYKASSGGWTWDLPIDSNSCAGRHQWSLCNCHCCVGCRSSAIILIESGRLPSHWAKTRFSLLYWSRFS